MSLTESPEVAAYRQQQRDAKKNLSYHARNAEDYERLYRNKQKWMHVALILRARIEGNALPEATKTEWAESYEWVERNVKARTP